MRFSKTFPRSEDDDCAILQRTFLYELRILPVICYIVIKNFKRSRCQDDTGASAVRFLTVCLPKGIAVYPTRFILRQCNVGSLGHR